MNEINYKNAFASWQQQALNPYWSYSFVNNSAFYAKIPAQFQTFMRRFVQIPLQWNDGWCPYFHDSDQGIFNTGLGGAIVNRLGDKVFGTRLYFKNDSKQIKPFDIDKIKVNESVSKIEEWAEKVNFGGAVHKAIKQALAGGTSALRVNSNARGELWVDAWRFDKFFPVVNGDGSIESVTFYLMLNIPFNKTTDNESKTTYTLEEHRYYGDYKNKYGVELKHNAPMIEFRISKMFGTITEGVQNSLNSEVMRYEDLPRTVKDYLRKNYPKVVIGKPALLPFNDWLGVELINATDGISALPELPFGESILHKIIPMLQDFDYAYSAMLTDMYIGKGRVLVPKGMTSPTMGQANSGLDSNIFEAVDYVNPDNQKPVPIQFDLRSTDWKAHFENTLNTISVVLGVSPSTLASFLQDNSPKTAREVSSQENETMQFVNTTRGVIEPTINRILDKVRLYMGLDDKVSVRWTYAGMENPYILAETLSIAKAGGFLSTWGAIKRFNFDDNEAQLAQEYKRVKEDIKNSSFGNSPFDDDENVDYFGTDEDMNDDNEVTESAGISN